MTIPAAKPVPILQLTSTSDLGGAERMALHLAQHLDPARFQPQIASLIGSGALIDLAASQNIPATDLQFRSAVDPAGIRRLVQLIRREKIQVVQTHGLRADSIARWAARLGGARAVISTIHSIDPWRRWQHSLLDRVTAPFVSHFIAVCEAAKQATIRREHIRPDRISVVYIGLPEREIPRERRDELRAKFNIPPDAYPVVGILANLREMKGHRHAVAALPAILQQFPKAHFLFAGRDDSNGAIAQFARDTGVAGHISAPGFIQDSAEVLAALDLFLLPSDWEGTPVSIIEAMQAGVPVIATRVGGIPELLRDDIEGVLIPPGQPNQIARAVVDLTNDWPRRARLAKSAEARALTTFSIDQMTARTEKVYLDHLATTERTGAT